jgi:DNA-binding transcriptional MerR regulator
VDKYGQDKGPKKDFFTISALAEEFDISTRTIRFYEEKNLISPNRTDGNQRIYSRRDRARLKLILRGKRFGYSLEEISEIIGMTEVDFDIEDQIKKTLKFGKKRLDEIRERINELTLLEQDLLTFQEKIKSRLDELKKPKA